MSRTGSDTIETALVVGATSDIIPFAPLMQWPAGVDAEAWLRQCVNRAQAVPMDEPLKANYLADLAILSGLTYRLETLMAIISEATLYESSAHSCDERKKREEK